MTENFVDPKTGDCVPRDTEFFASNNGAEVLRICPPHHALCASMYLRRYFSINLNKFIIWIYDYFVDTLTKLILLKVDLEST